MKGHRKKKCQRDQTIYTEGVYHGSTYDGKPSGHGTFTLDKRNHYKGGWLRGRRHGYGVQYNGGSTYKGQWKYDLYHGPGKLTTPDLTYVGGFRNGKYNGHGELVLINSQTYNGNWSHGAKHGHGTFTTTEGTYVGEFYYNDKHGHGLFIDKHGSTYTGGWRRDYRHGIGVHTDKENTYTGDWMNNQYHGQGKHVSTRTGTYVGRWNHGKRHQKGHQVYLNGSEYTGGWLRGLKTGYGTMIYEDGSQYIGFWLEDEYNGRGTLTISDSVLFKGEWLSGKREGVFEEQDGEHFISGKWTNDVRHGTFSVVHDATEMSILYLWGVQTELTPKRATKAVRRLLKKKDYSSAKEILLFFPTIVKWNLFYKYDNDGVLLSCLDSTIIRKKFIKYAFVLFSDERYAFVEMMFSLSSFCQMESILFDCITHGFVANPWRVGQQSYSKDTKKKLLEGLHLGEFGRCGPKDPFTRNHMDEKSGQWLQTMPDTARTAYQQLVLDITTPEEISDIVSNLETNMEKIEQSIREATENNDRKTIRTLIKERNNIIQRYRQTQRASTTLERNQ